MATSELKRQGVSPCLFSRSFWPVFSRPSSSVWGGSSSLCPRSNPIPWEASCGEPPVRDPLALGRIHKAIQPSRRVVGYVPLVQPKRKLIDVTAQVLRAGVMVDTVQPTLQDGPNALDAVRVSRTTGVLASPVV